MSDIPLPTPQPTGLMDGNGKISQTGYRYLESLGKAARSGAAAINNPATAAQYRANTSGVLLAPPSVWDAMAVVALTDAATVAIDLSLGFDFSVTIAGNRTLGNPSNVKVGQRGRIAVTASGTRTLNKGANWKSAGTAWPISIPSGEIYYIYYDAETSSRILVTGILQNPA